MKMHDLAKVLLAVGGIAMAVGALDPMEGSMLILPGSGLLALGTWLSGAERRAVWFKVAAFLLLAVAFAALWGFTFAGGTRSVPGISLMVVPYLAGWNMGIWSPGSPRWLLWLGAAVGVLFLVLAAVFIVHGGKVAPLFAVFGAIPLGGCLFRLTRKSIAGKPVAA